MSGNTSKTDSNSGEEEEEFCPTSLKLRNDMKRRVHNGIEKRRKDKINYWIHKLAELLPFKEPKRESKTHLLENIFQYINELKAKNDSLMSGNQNTIQEIHVEEIRRLTKRCKDLEEKSFNYYRLLERAGISPNGFPQDIHFERPTKYSKKITEHQLSEFLGKTLDKKSDQLNGSKRVIDFDENCGLNPNKKSKSSKSRSKRRKDKEKRDSDRKSSPPTPVLPNTMNSNNNGVTAGQTSSSAPFVILNDQNVSTISAEDTPRLIVNTSTNSLNSLNTIQIRPTVGSQQLQFISTNHSLDSMHSNTNLLSGQIVLNLNHPCPQPQPQATAVLLPNGQILPIITQPQQTQQPLLLGPNHNFLFTTSSAPQTQPTIITGQTSSIANAFNTKTNSINLIQNTNQTNETQNPKAVVNEKPKEMTTTIETIPVSPIHIKKKINKRFKKQISGLKTKNSSMNKTKDVMEKESKMDNKKPIESKDLESKSSKTGDNRSVDKSVINKKEKNKNKSQKCDKSETKIKTKEIVVNSDKDINIKSNPDLSELSAKTPKSNPKTNSNCDILAKATQSIFSPPPSAVKQVPNSKKKEALISNKSICDRKQVSNNININTISDNKCAERQDSKPESAGLKSNSTEKKVISKYCANSADSVNSDNSALNTANKALESINDTNNKTNNNYIENRSENNSKLEKSISEGNKAEINKKLANNTNTCADGTVMQTAYGLQSVHKLSNVSTPEQTTQTTNSQTNSQINTSASHSTEQVFDGQNISNSSRTTASNTNRLSFGYNSQQNQTNNNSNCGQSIGNQSIVENELPSLLLSSLNDENEVSAESVHSVSNSSLPAFLTLSPEHLNEYLPKDNITNNSETEHSTTQPSLSSSGTVEYRLDSNEANVEQHPTITTPNNPRIAQKQQQNYAEYRKASTEGTVVSTPQTETRSSYSSNFPTISSLINNDYSDFSLNTNKSMFSTNNCNNYLENLNPNPLMNHKMNSQNNNFLQFGLQNDNSLMPLYSMHSYHNYLQNNTNSNSNTNRNFFPPNETQPTPPKPPQNQTQPQVRTQPPAPTQQPKPTPPPQQSTQNQVQNQSNAVMSMRSQRNSSTEQQLHPQHSAVSAVRPEQRLTSQPQQTLTRDTVSSNTSPSNAHNKSPSNVSSVQYSTQNSFSSYSAEALIRQNEPTVQPIQSTDQNRYNTNANNSVVVSRLPQQSHSSNISFNGDSNAIRSSSRASISYSAESLIQSNSMNNSNPMTNKSSQREVENESLNGVNSDNNNRISYYQHFSHNNNNSVNNNNNNISNNLMQRTEQNNSNNLFNFDHSLNTRLMSTTSNPISQNCGNSYPQITFNSHLPDIRTSTTTTSTESLFPITSNTTTVNSNSNRNLSSNTGNVINNSNNNNNQISHTAPNIVGAQQQHSPVIYPTNSSQNTNSQQNKRSANNNNNSFNPSVNAFIHSNAESYSNPSHSSVYPTTGSAVDSNLNPNPNQYQRSARNNDIRFTNCLQPTHQNPNTSMTQTNNTNTGCFFSNTAPNTTFFPPSSGTPFPPLLPSAASPFDGTAPFTGPHRPPMFTNTFMPDFNPPFVNTSANNPLPPIASNFNLNPSVNNNSNTSNTKTRETQPSNTRSASNLSRSPNQSKHSKVSANNNKSNSKKQNNSKQNTSSDGQNNTTSNTSIRHSNDNYFSMNDLMSLNTSNPQNTNRYSNFLPNNQTHASNRQPVPSPANVSSNNNNTNNKIPTSSADTSSSYTLFRPQSQNSNNGSNVSNVANFSVNSLHTPNRSVPTTTPSNFVSSAAHHSSHVTNFHLSNIFPDINSNNTESLSLSPMKFPPPVTPVAPPPPVGPPLGQTSMDVSAGTYQNHHSTGHHQNLYHSHHPSARISTTHNAFNTFLSSGTSATHNTNTHSFDPHITPNNRTASTPQMSGISTNTTHPSSTFASTHPHSHHTYANIVPSFNF